MNNKTTLTIVIPCHNEEEVLPETVQRLSDLIQDLISKEKISQSSTICFIDDGSTDRTWILIEDYATSRNHVKGLKLAKNRGHQNALLAGLLTVTGDIVVSIDADLQDDISVIEGMVDSYHKGHEIVYGVREERSTDTFFKRTTAELYYKFLKYLGVDIVYNHADFRLLSRRALDALKQYKEVNLFLRGIVTTLGFPFSIVTYKRKERFAGESKYPLKKMLALAIDGITSFSAVPLRLIAILGFILFLISMFVSFWALWVALFTDRAVPGWASSVLPMYLLGGVQLLSIGILGEYIAKTYMETKERPRYIIEKQV